MESFKVEKPNLFISIYNDPENYELPSNESLKLKIRSRTKSKFKKIPNNKKYTDVKSTYLMYLKDYAISEDLQKKRDFVKMMMKNAWSAYQKYAWGSNEVDLVKKIPNRRYEIFYSLNGVTIVDSFDTLYIMGLEEEVKKAMDWISFHMHYKEGAYNLFETTIRILGGLISSYQLTKNKIFLNKAVELADLTLSSFDKIFPYNFFVLSKRIKYKKVKTFLAKLSEIGSFYLEYSTLSHLTNNKTYREVAEKIFDKTYDIFKDNKGPLRAFILVPYEINVGNITFGQYADSFFEYLLKAAIINPLNKKVIEFFKSSVMKNLKFIKKQSKGETKYIYLSESTNMEMLTCFTGGMFALASTLDDDLKAEYLNLAKEIVKTCFDSCNKSVSGLCPENFDVELLSKNIVSNSTHLLRPETMESIFYLYRITNDSIYQEMGWKLIQNIHNHCFINGGYSVVENINVVPTNKTGNQESFFLAETLKYAYLLFSDSRYFSLNEWVFNTEAHPFKKFKS